VCWFGEKGGRKKEGVLLGKEDVFVELSEVSLGHYIGFAIFR